MLATDQEMMDVLMALARVRVIDRELGTVEIEMRIPKVGLSRAFCKLLRVAARHDVAVPPSGRRSRAASTVSATGCGRHA
jgi:hypothetical protein